MDPWLMVWSGDHGSMDTLQEELRWSLGKKTFKRVFFLGFFYRGDNLGFVVILNLLYRETNL